MVQRLPLSEPGLVAGSGGRTVESTANVRAHHPGMEGESLNPAAAARRGGDSSHGLRVERRTRRR
jgi:hypothetical protein